MVNNKDFGNRIQKIMDFYGVSASSFADYMGVGRSSISHILSGRNKPSLDFVMKITEAYSDVDMQWLLYGKGSFPKSENSISEIKEEKIEPVKSKPSSTPILEPEEDLFSQPIEEVKKIEPDVVVNKKTTSTFSSESDIDRIVIFYKDGTFNSYQMKKS